MNGSSRAFGLNLEETVMNRSSRAFGLNLEERLDVCGFVDVVDPNGRWGLILDERMMNDGPLGLGLRMNEKRRTKRSFLDSSGTWMLERFGVSELQSFKV
ncbi:hypothetical protein ACFX2G_036511 [Malus domestica]